MHNTRVEFSNNKLTVKQALEELSKVPGVNLVYGSKEKFLKLHVEFSSKSITVERAFEEIKLQLAISIIVTNTNILIKSKELNDFYKVHGFIADGDSKERLAGVILYISDLNFSVVSNTEGEFSFKLKPGNYKLFCRLMGYYEKQVELNLLQDENLKIMLEIKPNEIKEVTVIQKVNDFKSLEKGRTIETIEAKVVDQLNTNDVNDALHGRLNGVWTTKVSGAPGDHHSIKIRGVSSIFGSTDPLYVVDGVIVPVVNFKTLGISDLNTHDVKSITILKDASSTALYGCLGGNGVVVVETKTGGGKPSFNFTAKKGCQRFNKRYNLLNAKDFLSTLDSSDRLNGTDFYKRIPGQYDSWQHKEEYPKYNDSLKSDNFQDEIFQQGEISEYQLSGQGKVRNVNCYISGGYYDHKGIIVSSNYKKYTLSGNFSRNFGDRLSIRVIYKGSHQENKNNLDNYMGNNVIFKGINYEPAYRFTPDTLLERNNRLYYNDLTNSSVVTLSNTGITPDDLFYKQSKTKHDNINSVNLIGYFRLNQKFSFHTTHSLSYRNSIYATFLPQERFSLSGSKFLKSNEDIIIINQQYDVNYEKQSERQSLNALLRYRNYSDNAYWRVDSVRNVDLEGLTPASDVYLLGSQAIFGTKGSVIRSINSVIFNVNYEYQKKYFFSVILNVDKLKEGLYLSKFNFYPSISLNWDLTNDRMFRLPLWVSSFNLHSNFGMSGNYPLNSLSNDLFNSLSKYTANNQIVQATYLSTLANHYIVPEKVTEANFGSELKLFKNGIEISADYYLKKNSDLLIQRTAPIYYGAGFFYQNVGIMMSRGVELALDITPFNRNNFYLHTRFGYSTNKQYLKKLVSKSVTFKSTDILIPDFVVKEDERLGAINGYKYKCKVKDLTTEEATSKKYVGQLGLAYYLVDSPYHKVLRVQDKTIIGNSIPDFTINWLTELEIKNFSFEMLWYGSIGNDKYNATMASTYVTGVNSDVRNVVLNKYTYNADPVFYESSYFIEDASFVKLKTISFSYTQPKRLFKVSLKYTLSFENLVTITHYSGYDPEASVYTNNNFTDNAIDRGAYPNAQGIFLTINMTF